MLIHARAVLGEIWTAMVDRLINQTFPSSVLKKAVARRGASCDRGLGARIKWMNIHA